MGGRIECYLDLASLYSYFAFAQLQQVRGLLKSHSVELEYHPVLLAGINVGSGNKPPFTLPAKRKYGLYDAQRSMEKCGKTDIQFPENFMAMATTTLPQRALHFIKRNYPPETFETAMHWLFHSFWSPPNLNITEPAVLSKALADAPANFKGGSQISDATARLFSPEEVNTIMRAASSHEMKDQLKACTQEALDRGAFGAPWLWVTNSAGHGEPFFGSDRFHFIYKFLDLPYQDVALLPPGEEGRAHGSKL